MSNEYLTIYRNRDPRTVYISDIGAHVSQSWDLSRGISLKGRITEATRLNFANFLRKVDCMDAEASEFKPAATGGILVVRKLHLRLEHIPEDAKLFRLGEFPRLHIIRSDFLQRIQEAGLTGLEVLAQGKRIS